MSVYNVAAVFRKQASQNYGPSIDQLAIWENQLASFDGKLSPGNYDLLINGYNKLLSSPGLSQQQRSDLNVKISGLEKGRSVSQFQERSGIDLMNRDFQDDMRSYVRGSGTNPQEFLLGKEFSLTAKLERLNDAINLLDSPSPGGDPLGDPTTYFNEAEQTINELQKTQAMLNIVEDYDGKKDPESGYWAFVETNDSGEIINVDFDRTGSKSGYVKTNAVMGGFQVAGKVNREEAGKDVFILGDNRYSTPDELIARSQGNPLAKVNQTMTLETSGRKRIETLAFNHVDSSLLRVQGYVGEGGWAQGMSGNIYQKSGNGYVEYTGEAAKKRKEELDAANTRFLPLNVVNEQAVRSTSFKTVSDIEFEAPLPTFGPQPLPQATASRAFAGPQAQPLAVAGAPPVAPVERSPQGATGIAGRTLQSARGFLGRIFGNQ